MTFGGMIKVTIKNITAAPKIVPANPVTIGNAEVKQLA
jgi:hypothetical protein